MFDIGFIFIEYVTKFNIKINDSEDSNHSFRNCEMISILLNEFSQILLIRDSSFDLDSTLDKCRRTISEFLQLGTI